MISRLTKAHTGTYLASELKKTLQSFGIEKKVCHPRYTSTQQTNISQILGITTDNASNNDTLIAELESTLPGANSVQTRVRCFAHILNLVVKVCGPCIHCTLFDNVSHAITQAIVSGFYRKRVPKTSRGTAEDADAGSEDEAGDHEDEDEDEDEDEPDDDQDNGDRDEAEDDSEGNQHPSEYVLDADALAADAAEIESIIEAVEEEHHLSFYDKALGQASVTKVWLCYHYSESLGICLMLA